MGKKALWRGLASVTCFTLVLSLIAGNVMEANAGTIDTALGTTSSVFKSENTEGDPLYNKFTPDAQYLNADGTGNSNALIAAAIDLNRREVAEGSVLLKNDNGVLPLKSGSNVTLFGIRSHNNLIGSSFGVKAQGAFITLEQALGGNRTDFANTIATSLNTNRQTGEVTTVSTLSDGWVGDEFDFEGAGFNLNPTMIALYESLAEKYPHANNEGAVEVYDPVEAPVSELSSATSSLAQYGDAAIVVIARPSGESHDYWPGGVADGVKFEHGEPLSLTQDELDIINLAKKSSDKVVVLISSSASVEIGTLKNDPDVDAILWIGTPGCYGNLGVADILCGRVSPSGGLFDIFATYNMSAPAMQNMGEIFYANSDLIGRTGGILSFTPGAYTVEAEDLYVGYRYYETRYYDCVAGNGNAASSAGTYASKGAWNYDEEVTYGFGYGLSYTTFDYAIQGEPEYDIIPGENHAYATFNVKVTNTGNVAGKTPVQIYGQAPYTKGGIEKSAIQLLNFEKSSVLNPGQSEVVPVKVDLQFIASYDESANGGEGSYVLEPGDYWFAVGNGAHDALNAIMAGQGMNVAFGGSATQETASGVPAQAYTKKITEDFLASTAFATTKTGYEVKNQIPYSDWNYYQPGEVTYLSRADWSGTYPKSYTGMTLTNQEMIDNLNGKYYELATTDNTDAIKWGQNNGIQFYEMFGLDYDDPKWDLLLDQLTLEEAMYIFTFGGPSIPGAESIGTVETYMTENAGNGIAVNLNASKDPNAPWAIPASDPNGNWHPEVFANAPMGASTFNPELMRELGEFEGVESLFTGINILWGPGLNTHRTAYNGRNGEYYSEDPVLSGVAAMEFAVGALEYGLVAAPKHFAFNDQETQRGGVSPYMTEQRAREIELRAYQIAFEATKYDTDEFDAGMRGLMTSFSKIGSVECTSSYGLMTEILANEWGFIGYAVTDIYDDTDLWPAVLNSGTTCFDTRGQSGFYGATKLEGNRLFITQTNSPTLSTSLIDGDANLQAKLKDAVHKNIYAWSVSHLMNRYNSTTRIENVSNWWRTTVMAVQIGSGALMVLFAALFVLSGKKGKKKEVV